ncbi:hypothetical protein QJ854_gp583 [Moumouvirus goulette]|uniref:Uncharacterized protein n=1 Tax=Moumouvirus goulette TaxID=1247379 RepID=M1PBB2_9VIRU|nr:hypothetical protein QJ854_gp583 [Moumouvirus goulette]AGF85199.1 hypothetical protein glt_00390 [Moumouvirus goulette]
MIKSLVVGSIIGGLSTYGMLNYFFPNNFNSKIFGISTKQIMILDGVLIGIYAGLIYEGYSPLNSPLKIL